MKQMVCPAIISSTNLVIGCQNKHTRNMQTKEQTSAFFYDSYCSKGLIVLDESMITFMNI